MLDETTKSIVGFVAGAYSRLMPLNTEMTGMQYADLISMHYDIRNPAIGIDCLFARKYIVTIVREYSKTRWTYKED